MLRSALPAASAYMDATGTNQRVGAVDGSGTTTVETGASLTANHIVQTALIIGGANGSPATVTIDASDASGNPLGGSSGLALAGALNSPDSFSATAIGSTALNGDAATPAGSALGASPNLSGAAAVPEPSTLAIAILAVLACCARAIGGYAKRFR